jgi:hypothetical protein
MDKIKEKMPWLHGKQVFVQHDGAPGHFGVGNKARFELAGHVGDGWRIKFVGQPAQSPDTNILDLGLFAALKAQVRHLNIHAKNIDELMAKVRVAYYSYSSIALDHTWAHLFAVYNSILQFDGDNQSFPPHSGARKRHHNQASAVSTVLDVDTYNRVFNRLYL